MCLDILNSRDGRGKVSTVGTVKTRTNFFTPTKLHNAIPVFVILFMRKLHIITEVIMTGAQFSLCPFGPDKNPGAVIHARFSFPQFTPKPPVARANKPGKFIKFEGGGVGVSVPPPL